MLPGRIIALWIIGNLIAVGAFDIWAYFRLPREHSVSYWIQEWFQDWPVLPLVVGIILGHLAWPLHKHAEGGEASQPRLPMF